MIANVKVEQDRSEEMVADANSNPTSTVALPRSDNTASADYSASLVAIRSSMTVGDWHRFECELKSAMHSNDLACVNRMLDLGVNPNFLNPDGMTPLHEAILFNMPENIVNTLLDRGADPNLPVGRGLQRAPLLLAADKGNVKAFKLLLNRGVDLNVRDELGLTALHLAPCSGNATAINEILNCLLERGANINKLDRLGRTPLLYAVLECKITGVDILLHKGANPEIPDNQGRTPLNSTMIRWLRSGYHFHPETMDKINGMVSSLLANGANPNKPNKLGQTLLHLALLAPQKYTTEIINMLLANGARADIPDNSGKTALKLATAKGVVDVVKNYTPPYQPMRLKASARACIRSRLIENKVPLAKALAPNSDYLPLSNPMSAYLHNLLTL
ncbi:ankyrin repeat domain-containing protein [Endozoicomonas sp. SESOKO1]|uniref:ankyrin repeat domain-containing protein n=1 Tax=Endozoicomonas sp. SESOKO1 TaxID=2828742 RepID=UPI0021479F61|nr:ankyrin repeat domain-containing protein [Endozoicomonas sp. SESOKO1]